MDTKSVYPVYKFVFPNFTNLCEIQHLHDIFYMSPSVILEIVF